MRNKLQFWAEPRNTISIQVLRHELEIAQHILPTRVHSTRQRSVTDGRLPTDLTRETCWSGKENKREKKEKKTRRAEKKPANRSGHRSMTHIAPLLVSPPSFQTSPSPSSPSLSSKDVFTMFYHPIFFPVFFRDL